MRMHRVVCCELTCVNQKLESKAQWWYQMRIALVLAALLCIAFSWLISMRSVLRPASRHAIEVSCGTECGNLLVSAAIKKPLERVLDATYICLYVANIGAQKKTRTFTPLRALAPELACLQSTIWALKAIHCMFFMYNVIT